MALTQTQLAAAVAERAELTRADAKRALEALEEVVLAELGDAQKVRLGGLVQLTVRVKPATKKRQGRKPGDGRGDHDRGQAGKRRRPRAAAGEGQGGPAVRAEGASPAGRLNDDWVGQTGAVRPTERLLDTATSTAASRRVARAAGLTGPCLPQEASAHICANGWIRVIWSTDAPPIATETKRPPCTAYPGTGRADRRHCNGQLCAGENTNTIVRRVMSGRPPSWPKRVAGRPAAEASLQARLSRKAPRKSLLQ